MKQGLVILGVVLIAIGAFLFFLDNSGFTTTEEREGPFGIGETQDTRGYAFGIPNGIAWFSIIAGVVVALVGLAYDPLARGVRVR